MNIWWAANDSVCYRMKNLCPELVVRNWSFVGSTDWAQIVRWSKSRIDLSGPDSNGWPYQPWQSLGFFFSEQGEIIGWFKQQVTTVCFICSWTTIAVEGSECKGTRVEEARCCANKSDLWEKQKSWFVVFANYYCENTPTTGRNLSLQLWCHWMQN